MSWLEHKKCPVWNTRHVLSGSQECPVWNTRHVLYGTQEMSCVERTKCLVWNTRHVLFGTHEMFCLEHQKCILKRNESVNIFKYDKQKKLLAEKNCGAKPPQTFLVIMSGCSREFLGSCVPQPKQRGVALGALPA